MQCFKRQLPFILKALFLLPLLLAAASCGAKKLGPPVLYPSTKDADGYSSKDQAWYYEGKSLTVTVRQAGPEAGAGGSEEDAKKGAEEKEEYTTVLDDLFDSGYTFLRLDITNQTEDKMFYNPFLTVLMDNDLGYSKPLDYTDLYEFVREQDGSVEDIEADLNDIKDEYYDGTVSIEPGGKVSRLLIFRPLSGRAGTAELKIKDIYTVKLSTDVVFPFNLERPEIK